MSRYRHGKNTDYPCTHQGKTQSTPFSFLLFRFRKYSDSYHLMIHCLKSSEIPGPEQIVFQLALPMHKDSTAFAQQLGATINAHPPASSVSTVQTESSFEFSSMAEKFRLRHHALTSTCCTQKNHGKSIQRHLILIPMLPYTHYHHYLGFKVQTVPLGWTNRTTDVDPRSCLK